MVEDLGGPRERVHGEAGLTLSEVLSDLEIGIDANLTNDCHGVDVQDEKMVTCERLFLLVNEWKELTSFAHVEKSFKA